jgi:hypothetical protein
MAPPFPADRDDPRTLQGEITIGAPHLSNAQGAEEHEAPDQRWSSQVVPFSCKPGP